MRTDEPDRSTNPVGTRVRLKYTLLSSDERAPGLPQETTATPYTIRVNGVLQQSARVGDEALVLTASGRVVTGVVDEIEPADLHTFGRPARALVNAIEALHALARTLN